MKRVMWLVIIAMFAVTAYAQQPAPTAKLPSSSGFGFSNTITLGYAYNRTDYNLPGAQGFNGFAAAYTRKFTKHFDVTADFEYTVNNNGAQVSSTGRTVPYNAHDFGYRVGPRWDFMTGRFVPYIHFLAGGANTTIQYPGNRQNNFGGTSGNNFGFSWAGGGGVEGYLTPHWGVIFEYDAVRRAIDPNGGQWNRFTAGAAYRF